MTETQNPTQDKAAAKTLLVRLKPHNPKRGHVLKTYTYGGVKFLGERGWYRVNASLGEELRDIRQVHDDQDSSPAFDVCTEEEAKAIDEKEADASTTRKTAEKSTVVDATKPAVPAAAPSGQPARRGG